MEYTIDDIKIAVKESKTIAGVLRNLNLIPKGGNYNTVKKYFEVYNIDTSHFTSKRVYKDEKSGWLDKSIPIEKYLVKGLKTSSHRLKGKLINCGLKEHICESCDGIEWMSQLIPLELHHIDGNHYNNEFSNLKLLCPNCHTLTPNYKSKNKKDGNLKPKTLKELYPEYFKEPEIKYCNCGKLIKPHANMCVECYRLSTRKVERPPINELLEEIQVLGYKGAGSKYNVSDNAIRKWIKSPLTK